MEFNFDDAFEFIVTTKFLGIPLFFLLSFTILLFILVMYFLKERLLFILSIWKEKGLRILFPPRKDSKIVPAPSTNPGAINLLRKSISIGYVLWIGFGALLLITGIVPLFEVAARFFFQPIKIIWLSPPAMFIAMGLFLLVAGLFLLLQFRAYFRTETDRPKFIRYFKSQINLVLMCLFSLCATISVYVTRSIFFFMLCMMAYFFQLAVNYNRYLLLAAASLSPKRDRLMFSSLVIFLIFLGWVLSLVFTSRMGIQFGALPFFFLFVFFFHTASEWKIFLPTSVRNSKDTG
ncbi:MAG: hypothetical protein JW748_10345 [Anaerolineales bacterium]|nr:hypothetical protein [Anaerolineales bacterium]